MGSLKLISCMQPEDAWGKVLGVQKREVKEKPAPPSFHIVRKEKEETGKASR